MGDTFRNSLCAHYAHTRVRPTGPLLTDRGSNLLLPLPPSESASTAPTARRTRGPEGPIRQPRRWIRRTREDDSSTRFLRRIRRSRP
jgi:hypothetical protein